MRIDWTARSVAKAGHAAGENEDALALDETVNRVAVCDGASEGWGSGPWAVHLSKALVASPPSPQSFSEWLVSQRNRYAPVSGAVSWYAEEKQAAGAFSTFLSLGFSPSRDDGVKYLASAIGDTALFHRRGRHLVAKFPVERSVEFGNRPALVGSAVGSGEPVPLWFAGRAEPGDCFYVMTDALAEWFLCRAEAKQSPWEMLDPVLDGEDSSDDFADWVQSLRQGKVLKNDDATLVRAVIGSDRG